MEDMSTIGSNIPRIDALEKVTGKALYCTDIHLTGMLQAKVLRSPHSHARIIKIDTSKAERIPGVKCILTGKDVPDKQFGLIVWDRLILAKTTVRFVGDAVAAVAADHLEEAEEAIGLINVEYEQLPAVFDGENAVSQHPSAIVHPDLYSYPKGRAFGGPRFEPDLPNVFFHAKFNRGDLEEGFLNSDFILENRFSTARIQHAALEPHDVVVRPEPDGGLTMWVGRQNIWRMRDDIGAMFGIRPSKIRVIQPYVGGAFGGKVCTNDELVIVLLAFKTQKPVKLVYTRREVFSNGGARVPLIIYIKDGVKKDGTFIARQIKTILACGAYENNLSVITRNCAFGAIGTYRIPNFKFDSYGVYTNDPPTTSFRGLGSTQIVWAVESQIDMVAEKLRISPADIRRKNILKEGEPNVTGELTHSIAMRGCLDKVVLSEPEEKITLQGPWRIGKGIAIGSKYSMAPTQAMARIKILEDETIEVYHSADENGQGCNTVAAQIVAEEFKAPIDMVRVIYSDTLTCPFFAGGSTSSRVTYNLGNAVYLACQDAKQRLFKLVADRLDVSFKPESFEIDNGTVYLKSDPNRKIKIAELFLGYRGDRPGGYGNYSEGGELLGTATWIQDYAPENPETGQINPEDAIRGKRLVAFWAHTAKLVEVAVNIETGQVKVLRCYAAADMGNPINPKMCEQQAEGAIVMGIGDTLLEEMQMRNGNIINPSFTDYRVPSTTEIPEIKNIKFFIVASPHKDGPYGAKGFGEGAMFGMEAAIANAIYDAIGIRFKDLPITSEKILKAIKLKGDL